MKSAFVFTVLVITVILIVDIGKADGQATENIGVEIQVYPAGVIFGIRGGVGVGDRQELNLRVGYNITRRGNFGKHDNEEGGGPGFGFGYRYYFRDNLENLFLGARTDFWFMDIDWRDDNPNRMGTTSITVLQPTLEAGYNLLKDRSDWYLAPTVSFGYEINIKTDGEEVGEGAILLGGFNAQYKF